MKFIFWLLTAWYLASSLTLSQQWFSLAQFTVCISSFLIIAGIVLHHRLHFSTNWKSLLLFYLFSLSCLISAMVNADINLFVPSLIFLGLFISTSIVLPAMTTNTNKVVAKCIMIGHAPLVFIPFILGGVEYPYRSLFDNANSLGTVAATMFSVVLAILLKRTEERITRKDRKRVVYLLGLLIWIFYVIILTGSRTSFTTVTTATVIGLFFLAVVSAKEGRLGKFIGKGFLFSLFAAGGYWVLAKVTSIDDYFYQYIYLKFQTKAARGDLLDNRGVIWEKTIRESQLFGNGGHYFQDNFGLGAHNSFVAILGQYGWIPLFFFAAFFALSVRYAFSYALQGEDSFKYLPLLLIVTFLTLSLGEVMLFKVSMLSTFCCIGTISLRFANVKEPRLQPAV